MFAGSNRTASPARAGEALALPAPGPIRFHVDGETFEVDEQAAWWLPLLAQADWYSLAAAAYPYTEERLQDTADPFDYGEVSTIARGLAEAACGMGWPMAARLAGTALGDWPLFEAWAAPRCSFDLLTCRIHRTLAAMYAALRESCEKERDVLKLERQLKDPRNIPGMPKPRADRPESAPWSADEEAAAARAAMMQLGMIGGGRVSR